MIYGFKFSNKKLFRFGFSKMGKFGNEWYYERIQKQYLFVHWSFQAESLESSVTEQFLCPTNKYYSLVVLLV